MKEIRPESQKALEAIKEVSPEAVVDGRAILDFLEDYPIYDSQFVKEKDGLEWSIDVYKIDYQFIRALVPYEKCEDPSKPIYQRICKDAEFDMNSLAIVYPVKVMLTRYKTLEEINGRK